MCKLFDDWSDEIRSYCQNNNLSFEEAEKLSQCWGEDFLALQYYDSNSELAKKGLGLRDETPMPLVLMIQRNSDGTLSFEQTEHTEKYLKKIS